MEFPQIDPVAFAIGPLKVHWYGLMYMFGFAAAWLLGVYRAKTPFRLDQRSGGRSGVLRRHGRDCRWPLGLRVLL